MLLDNIQLTNNLTNQNDPQSVRCRVFVGNLNTVQMSKQELETIFSKYGLITGISMHKGFAFIQFTDEITARLAAMTEDQKTYYNMRIDVNIASEPKDRRRLRTSNNLHLGNNKRIRSESIEGFNSSILPNGARLGNLVNLVSATTSTSVSKSIKSEVSIVSSVTDNSSGSSLIDMRGNSSKSRMVRLGPASDTSKYHHQNLNNLDKKGVTVETSQLSNQIICNLRRQSSKEIKDYLICGVCKAAFDQIDRFIEHRNEGCRLRFSCRCKKDCEPDFLVCAYCLFECNSAWDLIKHCQSEHELTIFMSNVATSIENNSPNENKNLQDSTELIEETKLDDPIKKEEFEEEETEVEERPRSRRRNRRNHDSDEYEESDEDDQ